MLCNFDTHFHLSAVLSTQSVKRVLTTADNVVVVLTCGVVDLFFCQLNVSAMDNALYRKRANGYCIVTVNVDRNRFSPVFRNTPYRFSINRTESADFFVPESGKIDAIDGDAVSYLVCAKYKL